MSTSDSLADGCGSVTGSTSPAPAHRLPLHHSGTTSGDVHRVLAKLESSGKDIPIIRAVANWEPGFRPFVLMADALLTRGVLPPRMRELCVLHLAAAAGLDYEWQEHVRISAAAGVTDAERNTLHSGSVPTAGDLFNADELAAIQFVHAVAAGGEMDDALWDATCRQLGEEHTVELVFVVAWWAGFVPVISRALLPMTGNSHRGSLNRKIEPWPEQSR